MLAGDQAFVHVDLAGLPSADVCGNVLPSVLVYVLRPGGWALLGSFETCGGLDPLSAVQVAVGDGSSDVLQFRVEIDAFGEFLSGVTSFEAVVRVDASSPMPSAPTHATAGGHDVVLVLSGCHQLMQRGMMPKDSCVRMPSAFGMNASNSFGIMCGHFGTAPAVPSPRPGQHNVSVALYADHG